MPQPRKTQVSLNATSYNLRPLFSVFVIIFLGYNSRNLSHFSDYYFSRQKKP